MLESFVACPFGFASKVGLLLLFSPSSMKYHVFQFWCCSKTWFNKICWGLLRLHLFSTWVGDTTDDSEQMYPNYYSHAQKQWNIVLKKQKHFSFTQLSPMFARLYLYLIIRCLKMILPLSSLWSLFFLEINVVHSPRQKSKFHIQSSMICDILRMNLCSHFFFCHNKFWQVFCILDWFFFLRCRKNQHTNQIT